LLVNCTTVVAAWAAATAASVAAAVASKTISLSDQGLVKNFLNIFQKKSPFWNLFETELAVRWKQGIL
jgi:hypothetical protein